MIDELTADAVLDNFARGYDPYLFAADFGLSPDDALGVIREFVKREIDRRANLAAVARQQGHHGKKGGRPKKSEKK